MSEIISDLRLGRWQVALSDVDDVDALIVDAPYSARTHTGHARMRNGDGSLRRSEIGYDGLTDDDVRAFVDHWSPRVRGWIVSITDHVLAPVWAEALDAAGRYVFAPLPWVSPGSRVRLTGDGPSSWTCWIIVARPRTGEDRNGRPFSKWGTLPGAYSVIHESQQGAGRSIVVGSKPLALMRAIVRDYTRPGDLVCDPCAGGATTGRACQLEGRSFIGAEMDPETHRAASERLARPYTAKLFADAVQATQATLID